MNNLMQLFSVNTELFSIFGYSMSYVEFFGTLLNIATVYLLVKKNIWNWPVGIVAVVLFGALFYQLRLYADLFEQVYYFGTGLWGWYTWNAAKKTNQKESNIIIKRNTLRQNIAWLVGITILSIISTWVLARLDVWFPALFPEPASLPGLDATTTIMSFAAQILLVLKRLENWLIWIVVDVIAIGLYWYKEVPFVALLYAVFLVLATSGFISWLKTYKQQEKEANNEKRTSDREVLSAT